MKIWQIGNEKGRNEIVIVGSEEKAGRKFQRKYDSWPRQINGWEGYLKMENELLLR